jgi:hypothetical protein
MGQRCLMALSLIIVSLTSGCQDAKSTQCSNFTKTIAQVRGILTSEESFTFNSTTPSTTPVNTIEAFQKLAKDAADAMNKRAERIDQAVKIIEVLEVSEDQLKTLKTEYLGTIQKAGVATRSMATLYTARSKATKETINELNSSEQYTALSKATNTFTAETTQEAKLIGKLNTYCNAKAK